MKAVTKRSRMRRRRYDQRSRRQRPSLARVRGSRFAFEGGATLLSHEERSKG